MRHDTLLFDLDGTLTDTDALHFEAYRRLLAPHGIAITHGDYRSRIMGAANAAIMGWLFPAKSAADHAALADEKETLFRSMAGDMTRTPGLSALLDWAAAREIKTAVVTNAPRGSAGAPTGRSPSRIRARASPRPARPASMHSGC